MEKADILTAPLRFSDTPDFFVLRFAYVIAMSSTKEYSPSFFVTTRKGLGMSQSFPQDTQYPAYYALIYHHDHLFSHAHDKFRYRSVLISYGRSLISELTPFPQQVDGEEREGEKCRLKAIFGRSFVMVTLVPSKNTADSSFSRPTQFYLRHKTHTAVTNIINNS